MTATPLVKFTEAAATPVGSEAFRGLTAQPKVLSPWLFYDARGSALFEKITELPEYYLTRTERSILARNADEMVAAASQGFQLSFFELGAGTATKTGLLLEAALRMQPNVTFHAIDVSSAALKQAKAGLEAKLPGLGVKPIVADYTTRLGELDLNDQPVSLQAGSLGPRRRLFLYIGSSIGNFAPSDALHLLQSLRRRLDPGDGLLLGVDMVKETGILLAAYDDASGVTAEFNKNVLIRLNRELDADFDPERFRHRARWNQKCSRIEMHLESTATQQVEISALDVTVDFRQGETIHTENSYKFTPGSVHELLHQSGFTPVRRWSDDEGWFGVYLAAAE